MTNQTNTTTAAKTGIRIPVTALVENENTVSRLTQRMESGGTVTFFGVPMRSFVERYVARGITREVVHLPISREGTEEILKADIAIRARQLAQREDNAAIGYYASNDRNKVLEYYKDLWTSMNTIRTTWTPAGESRVKWDNRGTNGVEVIFPERPNDKFYIVADRCKSHLVLMRRLSGEEYDALETPAARSVTPDEATIVIPEF
jgi:hypothetical protein